MSLACRFTPIRNTVNSLKMITDGVGTQNVSLKGTGE